MERVSVLERNYEGGMEETGFTMVDGEGRYVGG